MIKLSNLKKSFGGHEVLKGINLEINKGDIIAVLGPSGSGKTTLIKCMNFLFKANEGQLDFEGNIVDLNKPDKKMVSAIRRKTGFVFQNFNLFENKTVLENVTLGLTVARRMPKAQAEEIGKQMLDKVGLSGKYDSYPSQLSGGQQQRVAIARTIAAKPDVIYFDEPTSALDPELIGEVLSAIRTLAQDGMTMVIVTHEMNFARNISNRIIFMDNGEIYRMSDTKDFFENQTDERI